MRSVQLLFTLVGSLALCVGARAQQAKNSDLANLQSYSVSREGSLVGTVVKYDPASSIPPMGAHVLIKTASGQVDVHLGNARVLQASHLALQAGDNIRIVGESVAFNGGTYFAARIVQKGTQAVVVRSPHGAQARYVLPSPAQAKALRGVR